MLKDLQIKSLKPKPGKTQTKYTDSNGLVLLVHINKGKYWQYNYRFLHKQKTLSLGPYPEISLKKARLKRDEAKILISKGIDPMPEKKTLLVNVLQDHTFEILAEKWLNKDTSRGESNKKDIRGRLKNHINPLIGNKLISEISQADLIFIFNRLETKGIHTGTIRKIWQNINNIYKYSLALGICTHNLAADVEGVLRSGDPVTPRKALKKEDLPLFLNKIDSYNGRYETIQALKVLILTSLRPGEIQKATWSEFDLEKKEWTIIIERMKNKKEHTVPISSQLNTILKELYKITGHRKHLFPNQLNPNTYMSENTLNKAIKSMGFNATAHGMRSVFSSLANEAGFNPDAIEKQLSHIDSNSSRRAYNKAQYRTERENMMQQWADFLDEIKSKIDTKITFKNNQ